MRWWLLILVMALVAVTAGEAQKPQRFSWMSQDQVQDNTSIIVYIDRQTAECYAVWWMSHISHYRSVAAAAFLGKVPCANVKVQ